MMGFCPKGPDCDKTHIKSIISDSDSSLRMLANFPEAENWADKNILAVNQGNFMGKMMIKVRCHRCGEVGHKSTYCQEDPISPEELN